MVCPPPPSAPVTAVDMDWNSTVLPVASATNFAAGEWISVFDNQYVNTASGITGDDRTDEGFWVHDVDGNDIYLRHYVGPEDVTVVSSNGAELIVTNSKKFRVGGKIIFGTGANRNVKTINSINHVRNRITCDGDITGAVAGATVYRTGTEKPHKNGSKVRKVATVTTTSSASGSSTITVADATTFAVGDDIYVERRSEADGTTDHAGYWSSGSFIDMRHTISSISGDTLTLDATIGYTAVSGALVQRLSRDVVLKATTPDTDHAFLYKESYTSNYNSTLIIKDVYFKDFGNDDTSTQCGLCLRGYVSTNNLPAGVTLTEEVPTSSYNGWLEGAVVHAYPSSTHQLSYGPLWLYDLRGVYARCCTVMHGDDGLAFTTEPYSGVFNSLVTGSNGYGLRVQGLDSGEAAYCYSSRCYYGGLLGDLYENAGVHDIITDANIYAFNLGSGQAQTLRNHRWRMTGTRYGLTEGFGCPPLLDSSLSYLSGLTVPPNGTPRRGNFRSQNALYGGDAPTKIVEFDHEYDAVRLYGYNSEAYYDPAERAWRLVSNYEQTHYNPGMFERVYVPANTTVRISAMVKLATGFNGSYPYLTAFDEYDPDRNNLLGFTGGNGSARYAGYYNRVQYTASAASAFEEKQMTVSSTSWPKTLSVGVESASATGSEGFWIKDIRIYLDVPYANPSLATVNNTGTLQNNGLVTEVRTTFDQQKKRLGGRLR